MPELPEVEMCRLDLANWGAGSRVVDVIAPDDLAVRTHLSTKPADAVPNGGAAVRRALVGETASEPVRFGKRLGWPIGDYALLIHLGMTGRWRRRDAPPRWGRLGLAFEDGEVVWFIDPRRFGCVALVPLDEMVSVLSRRLGPDAWLTPWTAETLGERLKGRKPIKTALLDQDKLAGLGNIHAAEALWRARVHPRTPCGSLTTPQLAALAAAIPEQLQWALDVQTADEELVYVTDGGDNPFSVYGRAGLPCPRCAGEVVKEAMSGRSTFWCPTCQPA